MTAAPRLSPGRQRSPALAAALVLVPGLTWWLGVLLPWSAAGSPTVDGAPALGLALAAATVLGAVAALALAVRALSLRAGRGRAWAAVVVLALVVLGWFVSPAGTALLHRLAD